MMSYMVGSTTQTRKYMYIVVHPYYEHAKLDDDVIPYVIMK